MTLDQVEQMTRLAMRKFASSVAVVTAQDEDTRQAMTATSVTSLSMDPPSLLVCIHKSAAIYPLMLAKQPFAVNILSRSQEIIAANCSGDKRGDERFSDGTWVNHADGPPMLQGAQAVLICSSDGFLDYGSHGIFVGRVVHVSVDEGLDPLIYIDGAYTSTSD